MTIHDKLPPESYQTYPTNLSDQQSGRYIGRAEEIPTFSDYKKKTQTKEHQSRTNYQSSISTIAGTASTGTKPSNNTSLATKSYCLTDLEAYEEDNLHKTNQDHPLFHLPPHLLENHSRPEQPSLKGYTACSSEPILIQHHPR